MPSRAGRLPAAYQVHCPTGNGSSAKHMPWPSHDAPGRLAPVDADGRSAPLVEGKPSSLATQRRVHNAPSLHTTVNLHGRSEAIPAVGHCQVTVPDEPVDALGKLLAAFPASTCSEHVASLPDVATTVTSSTPAAALPVTLSATGNGAAPASASVAGMAAAPSETMSASATSEPPRSLERAPIAALRRGGRDEAGRVRNRGSCTYTHRAVDVAS